MPQSRPMTATAKDEWLAGVDGCPAGGIAAFVRPEGDEIRSAVVPRFADVVIVARGIVAVDMPIGLAERVGFGGCVVVFVVWLLLGAWLFFVFLVSLRVVF